MQVAEGIQLTDRERLLSNALCKAALSLRSEVECLQEALDPDSSSEDREILEAYWGEIDGYRQLLANCGVDLDRRAGRETR